MKSDSSGSSSSGSGSSSTKSSPSPTKEKSYNNRKSEPSHRASRSSDSQKRRYSETQAHDKYEKHPRRDDSKHYRTERSGGHYRSGSDGYDRNRKGPNRSRDYESNSNKYKERKRECDERGRSDGDHHARNKERDSNQHKDYHDKRRDGYNSVNQPGSSSGGNRYYGNGRRFIPKSGSRFRDDRKDFRYRNRRDRSRSGSFDHGNAVWGKRDQTTGKEDKNKPIEKEKPNFGLSGKLTEETNTYRGVVIKYSEPPEARKPKRRWRLYPFKGEKALQTLYIHRESAYLIGRERKVVDLPLDHPSCSKQHAALQYRLVSFTREDGTAGKRVRPYLIDLDSSNGTYINNEKIESRKYVELLEKDVIKFGFSSREYVLLHEHSKDDAQDDDVKQEDEVKVKPEPSQ